MKILIVSPTFMPAYSFGGAPRVAYEIGKELAKRKHRIVVYTSDAQDLKNRLPYKEPRIIDNMEIHYFPNLSMKIVEKTNIFFTPQLITAIRKNLQNFDIIHLHEYRTFQNKIVHHYASKHKIPYILQVHGQIPHMKKREKLKQTYDYLFANRLIQDAAALLALNDHEAKQYQQINADRNKIVIVPNGIDLSRYQKMPAYGTFKKKYKISKEKKIILFIGRIAYQKGVDILVKAYTHLIQKQSEENSLLVLSGPDDGYLKQILTHIDRFKIKDRIMITGKISVEDKLSALKDAAVFVLPSRYEAFPVSILEALACGKPIIASRLKGIEDIIAKAGGVLFEPENHVQLANCISNSLNQSESPKSIELARGFVRENYSIEKVVDRYEDIYKQTIEQNKHIPN